MKRTQGSDNDRRAATTRASERRRAAYAVALVSLAVLASACRRDANAESMAHAPGSGPPAASAGSGNPLERFRFVDGAHLTFVGRVTERREAGSYSYVCVVGPDGVARWVATLRASPTVAVGVTVRVIALARARGFVSPRLSRRFDDLLFGMVRPGE